MAQQADHTDVPLPLEPPAQRPRHVDAHQIQNSHDLADDDDDYASQLFLQLIQAYPDLADDDDDDYANQLEHQLIKNSFEHVGAAPPPPPIADDIHQ